jgi:hypothetical protein
MAVIDITAKLVGEEELRSALQRMSAQDVPKAIRAGVRYAARGGRTAIAKNIRAHYTLSSGRIKDGKSMGQPEFRDGGQTALIRTTRKPITAMQFKARQTKAGLTMAIYRGQRTLVKSGFIAKGLPFKRRGPARFPLDVIHGPSIHAIYTGGRFSGAIKAATEQRIEEQLVTGILRSIGGMGRGFGRA